MVSRACMDVHEFERSVELPVSQAELFAWHEREGAFERLRPSWQRLEIESRSGGIRDGAQITLRMRQGPVWVRWKVRHEGYDPPAQFVDRAQSGPFASWRHAHLCESRGPGLSTLRDRVEFALPLDRLAWPIAGWWVRSTLARTFRQRHVRTALDLARHRAFADRGPQRVAVSGGTGLIGGALSAFLTTGGHTVLPITRRPKLGAVTWNPGTGEVDAAGLEGVDAVVHLAGEPVFGRWTAAKRAAIMDSRVGGTRLLCEALAGLERKPRVLVCGSAIGFYGDTGDREVDESSPAGEGFLAEVVSAWEAATEPAEAAGIRVVHLRTGVVNAATGGALAKLRLPFSLGLGGPLGGGRQWQSWIDLDDLLAVVLHAIHDEGLRGPVNAVGPAPVRQRAFARCLGAVLRRPAFVPLPGFVVRALFGDFGREALLGGQRVDARKLRERGFRWAFPSLEESLRHQLGRAGLGAVDRALEMFEDEPPAG